jgi:hypothetical protein
LPMGFGAPLFCLPTWSTMAEGSCLTEGCASAASPPIRLCGKHTLELQKRVRRLVRIQKAENPEAYRWQGYAKTLKKLGEKDALRILKDPRLTPNARLPR